MTQTPNYKLTQWTKTDRIQMEPFNQDNAKIDAALKAHDTAIAAKAAQSDLTKETSARTSAIAAETSVRTKAIAAETSARTSAVNTLNAAVAKLGNCQLYFTTYTGTGTITPDNPKTLTFPHKPMAVFISDTSLHKLWAIQGMPKYFKDINENFTITWSGNSISFYGSKGHLDVGVNYVLALLDAGT